MPNKKQKYTSQNGNTPPRTETTKKEHKSRYGKTFPKKETHTKTNLKWEHNMENKIRDIKQKKLPENNMSLRIDSHSLYLGTKQKVVSWPRSSCQ